MKCPYCEKQIPSSAAFCPACKRPLPIKEHEGALDARKLRLHRLLITLSWIACAALFMLAAYKVYFWIDDYRLDRQYTRGVYTPTVSEITLTDGRKGHAIIYYGEDGGSVYIERLGKTVAFAGGVARFEFADGDWFPKDVGDATTAEIQLTPLLIYESGDQRYLPTLSLTVDVPYSPITVSSPKNDNITVNTAIYPLSLNVVPGSTVLINGEDVTSQIDRAGDLTLNVNVYPIGDNVITLLVRTPYHTETRKELTIYRAQMDINLELDTSVATSTNSKVVTITGKTEPGALISVDTDHIADSLYQDMETGEFSFIANMNAIGENIVRFRASLEGKADSVISMAINYVPNIADYSKRAWKMDYPQLSKYFEQWAGRIFLCEGSVLDVFVEGDTQYIIMDVGSSGETQYLVLINESSLGSPTRGRVYSAYADVAGRYLYNNAYYPLLNARYMDLKTN